MGRRMGRRTERRTGRRTGRRMGRRMGRRTGRRTGRRMERRMERRTGRRTGHTEPQAYTDDCEGQMKYPGQLDAQMGGEATHRGWLWYEREWGREREREQGPRAETELRENENGKD